MHQQKLMFIFALGLAMEAHAQERSSDPLGPITQCINRDGFHYETKDRRTAAAGTRTVDTASGPMPVSVVDGYRLMVYRKSSSPLVNLKIERSAQGGFTDDRQAIITQMKDIAAGTRSPYQVSLETSTQDGIEVAAINNSDIDHVSGVISMYTLMDAANGNVATAYLLNQRPEVREYHSNAEYAELRDRFINLLSGCMARPTGDR